MRNKIKDQKYFEDFIEFEKNRLKKRKELVRRVINERGVDDSVRTAFLSILNYHFNILNAEYSSGYDLAEIKDTLIETIYDCYQTSFENRYVEFLWLISLSVLLVVDREDFDNLFLISKKDKIGDFISDSIIRFKESNWPVSENVRFPTPYQSLKEVITLASTNKEKATQRLKAYLDREWYKGHSDTGWYDSHKSKENIYSGYWSWESGALVKILGLDDSSLKDQQYYPYDMVHWRE